MIRTIRNAVAFLVGLLLAGLFFSALIPSAHAQVLSGSNSYSSSSSQSASGAQSNNANNVNIISSVPDVQRHESTATSAESVEVTGQQHFKTNTPVGLAAAVSFSSDYCGGTTSGGASAAGISIGASKPVFDANCQALRRAEKLGMAAVSAHNLGMRDLSAKLQYLAVWQVCTSNPTLQDACLHQGVIAENGLINSQQATPILP